MDMVLRCNIYTGGFDINLVQSNQGIGGSWKVNRGTDKQFGNKSVIDIDSSL